MIVEIGDERIELDIRDVELYYDDFKHLAEYHLDDILGSLSADDEEFNYNALLNAVMKDMKRFYIELLKRGIIVDNDGAKEAYLQLIDEYLQKAYEIGEDKYVMELDRYLQNWGKFEGLVKLMDEIDDRLSEINQKKTVAGIAVGATVFFALLLGTEPGRKLLQDIEKIFGQGQQNGQGL